MKILVLNSGSSSIKYQLIDMDTKKPVSSGLVERIGLPEGVITHKYLRGDKMEKHIETFEIPNHTVGLRRVAELLTDASVGVIKDPSEIKAIGHRMVHGGEYITDTCVITKDVEDKIKELYPLAPLHNPPAYQGFVVAKEIFPLAKHIAVFDTAFHQTMPPEAYRYALPEELYTKHGIRKYGFHGTSHKYVSSKAIELLGKKESKIITIHLGNGCSMAAVKDGKCMDTSMGLGPLSGLIMGTRSGDVDPSVVFFMVQQLGYSIDDVARILNKESGLKALCGSSDMRDVDAGMRMGKKDAIFAY
ncbi:MAG: acetate/propionate family kinase, partial [Flavobacteriales bacterium]|nr:acetate/propionate family kinase [Flavobacteriales bacterium]